jgi:excisionase family DNA binding protein
MIMNNQTTRFSSVQEIASMLRVSKMTVYRLIHAGQLPHVRVGRSMRIPTRAVWEYLHQQGISPYAVPKDEKLTPKASMEIGEYTGPHLRVVE